MRQRNRKAKKKSEPNPVEEYKIIGNIDWNDSDIYNDFVKRVKEFRFKSSFNVTLGRDGGLFVECKLLLVQCLEYLKHRYFDIIERKACVPVTQVRLQFMKTASEESGGEDIYCCPSTGVIKFSEAILKREFFDGSRSRYPLENEVLKRSPVKDKEGLVFWLLLHEFLHLFEGYDRHDARFFEHVLDVAEKELFLFES
ncbi:Hypothetical protein HVR_LOCUS704 [uncultured virus]|nr:Hypothetical protein HVR_LOCUS704 [uncultured virus]